jgi:putative transcriptional regulator
MKEENITRLRLDPKQPPKTDWRDFDAISGEERHQAALSDPDAQPLTPEQLAGMRRMSRVRVLRQRLGMTQMQFAEASRPAGETPKNKGFSKLPP